MKKILFFILATALMLNSGNKTGKAVNNTDSLAVDSIVVNTGVDKHSEAYIRQRIDTIYKTVGKSIYDCQGNAQRAHPNAWHWSTVLISVTSPVYFQGKTCNGLGQREKLRKKRQDRGH